MMTMVEECGKLAGLHKLDHIMIKKGICKLILHN